MAAVAKHVTYEGQVQGVGFRRQAERAARGRPVAGYVRNLDDGRVELVAEGEAAAVGAFLGAVSASMRDLITRADERDVPLSGFTDFAIRR